jgi:hypothetical protein
MNFEEPNWDESETPLLSSWKNPFIPLSDRLLIADGAIAFRDSVIQNLRNQLKIAEQSLLKAEDV